MKIIQEIRLAISEALFDLYGLVVDPSDIDVRPTKRKV